MATKKKGCGFLIIALIILLVGGGIAAFLTMSAVSTGKEFTENLNKGKTLVTPLPLVYSPDEDGEATVWHITNVSINAKNTQTGAFVTAAKPATNSTMSTGGDRRILLGSFEAEKDTEYEVRVTGLSSGRKISLSNASVSGLFGSIGMAIVGPLICGFIALIFGIIGLVKFLGSKNSQPAPPAA